jgi:hypothetical protein
MGVTDCVLAQPGENRDENCGEGVQGGQQDRSAHMQERHPLPVAATAIQVAIFPAPIQRQ